MNNTAILLPAFALAGWTFLVLLWMAKLRITSGTPSAAYLLGESEQVPPRVRLANRNYMNLLELPILFYVICCMLFASGGATRAIHFMAWTYVLLRVMHSLIHLSYNKVTHRLALFATSNFVLMAIWATAWRGLMAH